MREAGLEPARPEWTLEPESSESANSTTRAFPMPDKYTTPDATCQEKIFLFIMCFREQLPYPVPGGTGFHKALYKYRREQEVLRVLLPQR